MVTVGLDLHTRTSPRRRPHKRRIGHLLRTTLPSWQACTHLNHRLRIHSAVVRRPTT